MPMRLVGGDKLCEESMKSRVWNQNFAPHLFRVTQVICNIQLMLMEK